MTGVDIALEAFTEARGDPERAITLARSMVIIRAALATPSSRRSSSIASGTSTARRMSRPSIQATGAIPMIDRHEQVMAAFWKAKAECPDDEWDDGVFVATIPGLTHRELMDHQFVYGLLKFYENVIPF